MVCAAHGDNNLYHREDEGTQKTGYVFCGELGTGD